MVRDAIKPDVTMFLHYETIEEKGKEIVVVDIQRGTDRPYYLAKNNRRKGKGNRCRGYSAGNGSSVLSRQKRDASGRSICQKILLCGQQKQI